MDDEIGNEAHSSGILLRTDYSDEQAWQNFLEKLHENESEFSSLAAMEPEEEEDDSSDSQDEEMDDDRDSPSEPTEAGGTNHPDQDEEMGENSPGNDEELHPPIFRIINPPETSSLRSLFTSISNLGSLRLLNDVDIRHAPLPPQGTKRVKPPHRLIDKDGFQEIYRGKRIWIYDLRSNRDQSVRVVGQQGDIYGTAT
ncbi:hypothetical protein NLI96_g10087 [Meripilus lineatus]|uniref:Uncharacterized protein n=1 Tax=Meripilus lineatus TaxID=2056292 RepID=A0AAD5UUE4_9APHY|nr:hypothetical protein NLI96_g10087 [Physisporinus lineatus]